jgi:UDP-N-acetylglucosamine--N-acetylmuramyl-(pentapeptide) pyrophosphoryl-undecaprenol N-acetylglucosamine transferase
MSLRKDRKMIQPLFCVAGHSAGHIVPCITYAQQELQTNQELLLFGTQNPLDRSIIKSQKNITKTIELPLEKVPGKRLYNYPSFIFNLIKTTIKTSYWLIKHRPQKIISTGGYISVPVCIIGWALRIPIELFELNAVPGKASKFIAPFATRIIVCFSQTKQFFKIKKTTVKPYPIRFTKKEINKNKLLDDLKLSSNKKTVLVLGGSQGSEFINNTIQMFFSQHNLHDQLQVIHQTGSHSDKSVRDFYKHNNIDAAVFDYHSHLEDLYAAADIVICRSGAGTLFETISFNKPCITIPLETNLNTHQLDNARAMEHDYPKLVTVIRQKDIMQESSVLLESLQPLMASIHQEHQEYNKRYH